MQKSMIVHISICQMQRVKKLVNPNSSSLKIGKSIISNAETPTYNLVVDLDVSADNKTQIDVILDELTGDVIKAVGNGRLKLELAILNH